MGYVWLKAARVVDTLKLYSLLICWIRESLVAFGKCDSKFIKEDAKTRASIQ